MSVIARIQASDERIPTSRLVPARVLTGIAALMKSVVLVGAARDIFSSGGIYFPWFT